MALDARTLAHRAPNLADRIGDALAGSVLACRVCEARKTVTAPLITRYLAVGWPMCCGETMSLNRIETP